MTSTDLLMNAMGYFAMSGLVALSLAERYGLHWLSSIALGSAWPFLALRSVARGIVWLARDCIRGAKRATDEVPGMLSGKIPPKAPRLTEVYPSRRSESVDPNRTEWLG